MDSSRSETPALWQDSDQIRSNPSLSRVRLFVTPWIAALQASLSITNSWSSLRLMSIESVMPSSHLILCRPLLLLPPVLPASESFPMSQLFAWGGQSTGVSALASFLPKMTRLFIYKKCFFSPDIHVDIRMLNIPVFSQVLFFAFCWIFHDLKVLVLCASWLLLSSRA